LDFEGTHHRGAGDAYNIARRFMQDFDQVIFFNKKLWVLVNIYQDYLTKLGKEIPPVTVEGQKAHLKR